MGVICHYWYIFLDKFFKGHGFKVVMSKVFWDQVLLIAQLIYFGSAFRKKYAIFLNLQIILSPVMWAAYVAVLCILDRSDLDKFKTRLKNSATHLYTAEWIVWPPAQVTFLP